MKKGIVSLIIAGALCLTMGTTAFAGSHNGGHNNHNGGTYSATTQSSARTTTSSSSSRLALCPVSGCTRTGNHSHNGTRYAGHHTNDGHKHTTTNGNSWHPGGYSHSSSHNGYHR